MTHLGSPVNWYSIARHWQRPVVVTVFLAAPVFAPAGLLEDFAVASLVVATLVLTDMGNS
jgi:hypothetical protein